MALTLAQFVGLLFIAIVTANVLPLYLWVLLVSAIAAFVILRGNERHP